MRSAGQRRFSGSLDRDDLKYANSLFGLFSAFVDFFEVVDYFYFLL